MQLFGKRRYVVLAFAVLVVFWGSAFSVVKVGLEYSPPMSEPRHGLRKHAN